MQDSLEDFIRLSRQTKSQEATARNSNEVLIAARKKKECEARAMQVLELCIEGKLHPEAFFQCLPYINHPYYQDIVEERAVIKLCGYPLCGKKIPDMPKKQFHISTKSNKVYDITERKNYCSNYCYKASVHIKNQIDNSPLWLRNFKEVPNFTLLKKSDKGLPGEEIDQGIIKPVKEPVFTPVGTFTEVLLDEIVENEINPEKKPMPKKKYVVKAKKVPMKTISEGAEETNLSIEKQEVDLVAAFDREEDCNKKEEKILRKTCEKVKDFETKSFAAFDRKENCNKKEEKILSETCEKVKDFETKSSITSRKSDEKSDKRKHKRTAKVNLESNLLRCFKDWINLETFLFIYGESKVKETLSACKLSHYFESLKIAELQLEQQKKYLEICKNLHLRELAEEKFDNAIVGNTSLKPIPDYQLLKKEGKQLDLKVKSFYGGVMSAEDDPNFPTKKESEPEEAAVVLPLVNSTSQNAMRRKIFLNALSKTMENLLQNLKVDPTTLLPDVQVLVKTFKLKADNIVFTPTVWNYIAIAMLKILAIKDKQVKALLEKDESKEYLDLYLTALPTKGNYINSILELVQDVDKFVQSYIVRNEA